MKNHKTILVLAMLLSMANTNTYAYDIAVENEDGIKIYYNYINDRQELEVTCESGTDCWSNSFGKLERILTIPETVTYMGRTRKVTRIGSHAFSNSEIYRVIIPNTVTKFEYHAFCKCKIDDLEIGDGVTELVEYTFNDVSLKSIAIGSGLKKIARQNYYGIQRVIIDKLEHWYNVVFESYSNNPLYCGAGNLYVGTTIFQSKKIDSLEIPKTISKIKNNTFAGINLKYLKISDNVKTIGDYSFYNGKIESLFIGKGLLSVGRSGLPFCDKVETASIATWSEIDFDDYLPTRGSLFYNGEEITDLTIPEGVKSIGNFRGLKHISNVTIPQSAKKIKNSAFYGCDLRSVTIPDGVTFIDTQAFYSNKNLEKVEIGKNVTTMGYKVFGETIVSTVISHIMNPRDIPDDAFDVDTYYNATLYVPAGTAELYKAANGWKNFDYIEEDSSLGVESHTTCEPLETARYTLKGTNATPMEKGLNIVKMSDGTRKKIVVK